MKLTLKSTDEESVTEEEAGPEATLEIDVPARGRIHPLFAVMALVATLCFAALLFVQWQEYTSYYKPGAESPFPAFSPGR